MSTFSIGLNSLTSMKNSKSKKFSHKCRICRAPAEHTHFGVISCDSCKMFFRRNGNTEQVNFIFYLNRIFI
jgi:ribosomal protein L37AE/L43A